MPLHHPEAHPQQHQPGAPPTTTSAPTDTHDGISGILLNMSATTHLTGENGDGLNFLAIFQLVRFPMQQGLDSKILRERMCRVLAYLHLR